MNKTQNTTQYKTVSAEIYNFRVWTDEISPEVLSRDLTTILTGCGYHILNHIEHHFPVKGYTALWLLAESHLAVHTFPEDEVSYIELSGCNKAHNELFRERFAEKFHIIER